MTAYVIEAIIGLILVKLLGIEVYWPGAIATVFALLVLVHAIRQEIGEKDEGSRSG